MRKLVASLLTILFVAMLAGSAALAQGDGKEIAALATPQTSQTAKTVKQPESIRGGTDVYENHAGINPWSTVKPSIRDSTPAADIRKAISEGRRLWVIDFDKNKWLFDTFDVKNGNVRLYQLRATGHPTTFRLTDKGYQSIQARED